MDITLTGKTALISGGSKGLGLAMATEFAKSGANVAILARGEGPLAEAEAQIAATAEGDVSAYVCDVSDAASIQATFARIVEAHGGVDIVVNNAGQSATGAFMELSDKAWQADLDLKLFAAIRLTRCAWPYMLERRWGRVINILNTAAKAPPPGSAPTSVSRAAGMALTKVLSGEGAAHNILVNALLIGFLKSDQIRRTFEASGSDQTLDEFMASAGQRLPMGRMGEAEECANLAVFLASDKASYVTGCAINMDGGLSKVV